MSAGAARARALLLAVAAAAAPQASLPDIEDEVMCVECGTALNVSTSAVADQERAFIRRRSPGQGQAGDQGRARRASTGPACWPSPRRRASTSPPSSCRSLLALLALAALAVAGAALAPRAAPAAAGGRPSRSTDDDARRLDAELAAFDRR